MILLLAISAGLLAGLARASYVGDRFSPPSLNRIWLVPLAFGPQWLAFFLPATSRFVGDQLAAAALVGSQVLLLIFAVLNWKKPGFRALGLGLLLNLLVITANGGLMPMSPETLARLTPDAQSTLLQPASAGAGWVVGSRLGTSKNVLLPVAATRLCWLSDRFLLPSWFPYHVAFSLGDALIAAGAFWLLWASGKTERTEIELRRRTRHGNEFFTLFQRLLGQRRAEPVDQRSRRESRVLQTVADQSDRGAGKRL